MKDKEKSNKKFDSLIKPHINKLYKFLCAYTKDNVLSQDLLQDCLIKAYLNIDSVRDEDKIVSWLYKIAKNSAKDYFKKNNISAGFCMQYVPDDSIYTHADMKRDISLYLMCLQTDDREILILKDMLDYSYSEIADMLDISLSNVGVRLYRARDRFREVMYKTEYSTEEEE